MAPRCSSAANAQGLGSMAGLRIWGLLSLWLYDAHPMFGSDVMCLVVLRYAEKLVFRKPMPDTSAEQSTRLVIVDKAA